jgi:hypothetical protein
MAEETEQKPAYEFMGPDGKGLIRLKMPNGDPKHAGELYCFTLGADKNPIAKAMCQCLSIIDYSDCH